MATLYLSGGTVPIEEVFGTTSMAGPSPVEVELSGGEAAWQPL